jgi:hypothetical protein
VGYWTTLRPSSISVYEVALGVKIRQLRHLLAESSEFRSQREAAIQQGTRMSLPKRKRGGPGTEKHEEKRLYLIFDDWATGHGDTASASSSCHPDLLPPTLRSSDCHSLSSAWRPLVGIPGTSPLSAPGSWSRTAGIRCRRRPSDGFMPIVDVRSRGTRGQECSLAMACGRMYYPSVPCVL